MRILVDLDCVLINTGEVWVDILNEVHGTTVKYDDVNEWDMTKFFPTLSRDEVYEPLSNGSVWSRVSPIPGARDTIERLIADGHEVYIVTASSLNTIGNKWREVIQKFFPMIKHNNVIVASNKQMIIADVLIDDAPHNIEGGKYFGILFEAPHNRSYNECVSGFARAHNWDDVYKVIETIVDWMAKIGGDN